MKKYQVKVNEKRCKACGICIGLCPKEVFGEDYLGKAVVKDDGKCTGCKICELHCPDYCVEVGETA
ncbi:MAG: 4Fe-4S binding protein [Desulfitobacteriaceae bacterium]|jgi:2-oxoglutarate ferredoxin oxidoreductase subunit delta|nr:4Fe-4S binding protein [Desulfitobacteriaceae bacterium]MDD4753203.1 4Fe-4S binding protein [Desulfitobacteriaceae bacterium]